MDSEKGTAIGERQTPLLSTDALKNDSTPANDGIMERVKKPSMWRRMAGKLGLSIPVVMMMAKGAIAPTVGLAIYQNSTVAYHFSTIGYLIPIMSILTVPVLPRARFIQNLLVTCLLICLAAAISLLAMWCAVRARANTTHLSKEAKSNGPVPGAQVSPYNAAASVNMAIWLFFEVWLANTFRAYRPQYFLPSIVFSIFINVTGTYGTQFATMEEAEALVRRLLETFFTGFGISAAVSIFIIPFTSRDIVSMRMAGDFQAFKTALKAQSQFMLSLPTRNWYDNQDGPKRLDSRSGNDHNSHQGTAPWPEADALKRATMSVAEAQVAIQSELRYAKREAAWAKLGAKDFEMLDRLLKNILLPVFGMESLVEVTDRIEKRGGWRSFRASTTAHTMTESELNALEEKEKEQWRWIFEQLRGPVRRLLQAMIEGLDHSTYALEFAKRPASPKTDLEANGLDSQPGGKGFAAHLEKMIQDFLEQREGPLKEWCASKGMDGPSQKNSMKPLDYPLHQRHQAQLFLFLDMEYSFLATARGILDLVKYADSKVDDGTMKRKRLILPGWKRMQQWVWAALSREDSNLDYEAYSTRSGTVTVYLGDALQTEKDAEHLPPVSMWEKATDNLRIIPHFFGSPESAFGFRVATGTMVIAVVCYLRNSQHFFIAQRIIWGSIMVAISMTQTAGSGVYGQFLRFAGTALAMVAAYIDWYIVDQHTAGVIVFVGITMFLYHYLLVKSPDNPVLPMIGMVTVVLIVGYALQIKQVGLAISESNGQQYHPLYELAPYRLAAVGGGVAVAAFFTHFPSVVTARTQLRKDLGSSLYLLAHYYSSVHTTVSLRIRGTQGDLRDKKSPGRVLEKARTRVLAKELVLLQGMKQHCEFIAWEPAFGGKFPRDTYDRLIKHTQNILHFTTMIAYVTESFQNLPTDVHTQTSSDWWLKDFKQLIASLELTSQEVTSLLSVVSGAIATGRPLPPYLKAPEPYHLGQLLDDLDTDILSTRHVCEPGYAAFAVMQVATTMLADDLDGLLHETKNLVGEVDFGINVVRMEDLEGDVDPITASKKRD